MTLYTKFSNQRSEAHNIRTSIIKRGDGTLVVKKQPDTVAAKNHVIRMPFLARKLQEQCQKSGLTIQPVSAIQKNDAVEMEFIDGESLDRILHDCWQNNDIKQFNKIVEQYVDHINKIYKHHPFKKSKQFIEVFGDASIPENLPAANYVDIDLIFQNIIVGKNGKWNIIDYEWTFDFDVPVDFVLWRTAFYSHFHNECTIDLFSKFKISPERYKIFEQMETHFQNIYLNNAVVGLDFLYQKMGADSMSLEKMNDVIVQKNNEINEKNQYIAQLQENIAAITNSRSWRITKPIRTIGEWGREVKIIKWPVKFLLSLKRIGIKDTFEKVNRKIRNKLGIKENKNRNSWIDEEQRFKIHLFSTTKMYYKKIEMPKFETPIVSIVIPVYNQFKYTYLCLKAIKEHSGNVPYEVIIADDCSTDRTRKINSIISGVQVVRNQENLRFLKNCNNAAKYAKGKYILFLNNDTQVQPDWLKSLVDLIESKDDIGMVGSKFVYPDGTLQEAGGIVWKDASAWNYGHGDKPYLAQYNYAKETDYISGASIMIKKKLWKEIGGFDETFAPAYYEDTDLAFEVRKRGQKVMFQPASVVIHFEGKSNGTDLTSGQKAYQIVNQKKFYEKWKDTLEKEHEPNGADVFNSRDRTKGKKTILVIDHYIPTFDMDCGSRWTFQLLKLFVNKNYNVKFIGDNYKIYEPYTTALEQLGIEILYGSWYGQNWQQWILENRRKIDIVFFARPHITMKYIDFVKENTTAKLFYLGHDLHFLRINREYALKKDKRLLDESEYWKNVEFSIMNKVSCSYYPSFVEVNLIHKIDRFINAKALPVQIYNDSEIDLTTKYDKANREGILFIGSFMHTPNVDAVIWFIQNVFPKINQSLGINFYVVGSNPPDEIKKLNGKNVIVKGFVTDEELNKLYKKCRMVVVPLRYGAGVKGKVIEAMKNGVPLITTTIGAEGILGIEKIAIIEDNADIMAKKISKLYNNEATLSKMSIDSRNFIAENYTTDATWNLITNDFKV